jgi:hypothetical protein
MSPPGKAVNVAEAELRKHLTPEQYYVTRDHGTEHPFTGPHLHESGPACFRAYVAERRCSMRGRSPGPAGRASMHRSGRTRSANTPTARCSSSGEPRCAAPVATRISATSSLMGRGRPAGATA